MATDQFETQAQPRKSGSGGCLKGCLIAFVIAMVVAILVGIYIRFSWRGWVGAAAQELTNQLIDESQLPEQEKAELKEQARRLTDGFADGDISLEQLGRIGEEIAESPLTTFFMVEAIRIGYVQDSGLSEEEKAEAQVTLQRLANGVVNSKIDEAAIEEVMAPVSKLGEDGEMEIKDTVTDEELREFLALAKQKADEAEIPDEVETIDPSDELKRIIDGALEAN